MGTNTREPDCLVKTVLKEGYMSERTSTGSKSSESLTHICHTVSWYRMFIALFRHFLHVYIWLQSATRCKHVTKLLADEIKLAEQ